MTTPKLKPCPDCGGEISVYTYESGWRRAECDGHDCGYIAEPAGNRLQAARNHNLRAAYLRETFSDTPPSVRSAAKEASRG